MNHNWSATKRRPHPQSVAEISRHSVLSGDRIRQCGTSSGSRHKDTDQSVSRRFLLQTPQCPCSVRKRFSRDHCCRGRSKPGCQIVGSHTKWELITWADFQFQASIDYWCQLVASPATAASWMSVAAMMSWYYTVCQKWDETCLILNLKSDHAGRLVK